jgi:hypothetical protein
VQAQAQAQAQVPERSGRDSVRAMPAREQQLQQQQQQA